MPVAERQLCCLHCFRSSVLLHCSARKQKGCSSSSLPLPAHPLSLPAWFFLPEGRSPALLTDPQQQRHELPVAAHSLLCKKGLQAAGSAESCSKSAQMPSQGRALPSLCTSCWEAPLHKAKSSAPGLPRGWEGSGHGL